MLRLASLFLILMFSSLSAQVDPEASIFFEERNSIIANCFQAINGSYFLDEVDYVVPGVEPIVLRRSYMSGGGLEKNGGWMFFPHLKMIFNEKKGHIKEAGVHEPNGMYVEYKVLDYDKVDKEFITASDVTQKTLGVRNISGGIISGRTNVKNNSMLIKMNHKIKHEAILTTGDGGKRIYRNRKIKVFGKVKSTKEVKKETMLLDEEIKPSGNVVTYKYDNRERLIEVQTLSPNRDKVYAWVRFTYPGKLPEKNRDFYITTSANPNQKLASYTFWRPKKQFHKYFYLEEIQGDSIPRRHYVYSAGYLCQRFQDEKDFPIMDAAKAPYIYATTLGGSQISQVQYYCPGYNDIQGDKVKIERASDARNGCVAIIYEGNKDHFEPAYWIHYNFFINKKNQHLTTINDSENLTIRYTISDRLRLVDAKIFLPGDIFYSSENYFWEDANLRYQVFYDPTGINSSAKTFTYDHSGNVIEERLYGNLSGRLEGHIAIEDGKPTFCPKGIYQGKENMQGCEVDTTFYTYSKNGFNLPLTKKNSRGLLLKYSYFPKTDLIEKKLTYDHENLIKRKFFFYNDDHICIKEIEDDGSNENVEDLSNVIVRRLTYITPKKQNPAFNQPEIVEEKYFEKGQEFLLKKTVFHYSAIGLVEKEDIFDQNNQYRYSLETQYDNFQRVIAKSNPIGAWSYWRYDDRNNLIYKKEALSSIETFFTYDLGNCLIQKEEKSKEGSKIFNYLYDQKHRLVQEEDDQHNITFYRYDVLSHLIEKILKKEGKTFSEKFSYDRQGLVTEYTDKNGYTTRKTYNNYGHPTHIIHPDGSEEFFTYNLDGTLKEAIDPIGVTTEYEYDVLSREIAKTKKDARKEILSLERKIYKGDCLIQTIDTEGQVTNFAYDGAGRKIAESKNSSRTEYQYDSLGKEEKIIFCAGPNTHLKILTKDLLDRVIEEKEEDLIGKDSDQRMVTTFDEEGNQSSVTKWIQGKEAKELFFYDVNHRLITSIDPRGYKTFITYNDHYKNSYHEEVLEKRTIDPIGTETLEIFDTFGNVIFEKILSPQNLTLSLEEKVYDGENHLSHQKSSVCHEGKILREILTFWQYDSMGRKISETEAYGSKDQKITHYDYTPRGELKTVTKPDGVTIDYSYNGLGQQIELKSSDNSHYTFSYNKLGHLLEAKNQQTGKSTIRKVDEEGNILFESLETGLSLEKVFDPKNRCILATFFDRSKIVYEYDPLHLKTIFRKTSDGNISYEHNFLKYDQSGHLLEEKTIFGHTVKYDYHLLGHREKIQNDQFSQTLDTMDALGRILAISTKTPFSKDQSLFSYDDLSQLIEEAGMFNHKYGYDSHYNRLFKNDQLYQINDINQIENFPGYDFVYDKNGNPILLKNQNQQIHFSYDSLDRLIEIEKENVKVDYFYDGLHRRIFSILYELMENLWIKKEERNYLYDNAKEIGTLVNGELKELRILPSHASSERGVAIALELNQKVYEPLHDLFGHVFALLNSETPEEIHRYSAFGEEKIFDSLGQEKTTSFSPWTFCSKRKDKESSLIFFGRRYYEPSLGRFLTPDPEGFTQGMNLYSFVLNDPLRRIDLFGLFALFMDPSQFYREKLYQGTLPTPSSPSMQYFSNVGIGMLEVARGQALETPFTEPGIRGRQAGREIMKDIAWAETLGGSAMATYGSFGTKAQLAIIAGTGGAAAPALVPTLAGSIGTTAAGTLLTWHGTQVLRNAQELSELEFSKNLANEKVEGKNLSSNSHSQRKVVGEVIKGYKKHGLNQAISRDGGKGVSARAILDAVKSPLKIVEQSEGRLKYVGKEATVILNKEGKIITTFGKAR